MRLGLGRNLTFNQKLNTYSPSPLCLGIGLGDYLLAGSRLGANDNKFAKSKCSEGPPQGGLSC